MPFSYVGKATRFSVDPAGRYVAAGLNTKGQLGVGDNNDRNGFSPVQGLEGREVAQIVGSNFHTIALTAKAEVFATGSGFFGQLGVGDRRNRNRFTLVQGLEEQQIVQLVVGNGHTSALTATRQVFATGDNQFGSLGVGDFNNRSSFTLVKGLERQEVARLFAGVYNTFAQTTTGQVFATGCNERGQLGVGHSDNDRNSFTLVLELAEQKVVQVVAGNFHTFALTATGQVFATGRNEHGELGVGDNNDRNRFSPAQGLVGQKIVQLVVGENHTLALTTTGQVFATGHNEHGQLGVGDNNDRNRFTPVQGLDGQKIIQFVVGHDHSSALTATGQHFATGHNEDDQLRMGNYDDINRFTPVRFTLPPRPSDDVPSLQQIAFRQHLAVNGFVYPQRPGSPSVSPDPRFEICGAHELIRPVSPQTRPIDFKSGQCYCPDCRAL